MKKLRSKMTTEEPVSYTHLDVYKRQGQVLVVGYDNIEAIKPMLNDGRVLATADQFASQQAVFGIDAALDALKNGKKQSELSSNVETPIKLIVKQ